MVYETVMNTIMNVVLIIGAIVVIGMSSYLVWFNSRFKIKYRLRELTGSRKLIFDDKAREIKKDGKKVWELLKKKRIVPVAPDDAIDVDMRGKKVVEAYLTQTDDIVYCVDNNTVGTLNETTGFKPMTTKQKHIYMDEMKKAYERSRRKWQDVLVPMASIAGVVMIAVALIIFYEDMGKPLIEMGKIQAQIAIEQKETMQAIQELIQKKQILD